MSPASHQFHDVFLLQYISYMIGPPFSFVIYFSYQLHDSLGYAILPYPTKNPRTMRWGVLPVTIPEQFLCQFFLSTALLQKIQAAVHRVYNPIHFFFFNSLMYRYLIQIKIRNINNLVRQGKFTFIGVASLARSEFKQFLQSPPF